MQGEGKGEEEYEGGMKVGRLKDEEWGKTDRGFGNVRGVYADELQVVSHKSTKGKRFCRNEKGFGALLSQGMAGLSLCFLIQVAMR